MADVLGSSATLTDESRVYSILEQFASQHIISWTLRIPVMAHAEEALRDLLERIEDEPLRLSAQETLSELETMRNRVTFAAGNARQLDAALADFEAVFSRLTGIEPTRAAGQAGVGRTLLYEDCQRDLLVEIGPQISNELIDPLSLLLCSARWFSCELAAIYRTILQKIYMEICAEIDSPAVPLSAVLGHLLPHFRTLPSPVNTLIEDVQRRWAELLEIPTESHRVEYTVAQLQERVQAAFPASAPGWKLARFHSADIHLAAQSIAAIQDDNYYLVLGDFHPTGNPLLQPMFMEQHPHPAELQHEIDIDLPEPRFILSAPRAFATSVTRRGDGEGSLKDYWLLTNLDSCTDSRHQGLAISELLLIESEGRLLVRTRNDELTFDPWDVFGQSLTLVATFHFTPFARWTHTPRVIIDRLVLHRESWRVATSSIPFAEETDEGVRFVAIRRWARSQGMPRFLFAKVPDEDKPYYVDFDSPIYVSLLARALRKIRSSAGEEAHIIFTEMLPDPDHAWLPDFEGRRYTSEFRLVAVDRMRQD